MPRAGAEYVYLRETYGPAAGFMSAFVSLVAGFSAPIAAALKSFVIYAGHFFPFLADDPTFGGMAVVDLIAVGLVWLLVGIHLRAVRSGTGFNAFMTVFKVGGIVSGWNAAAYVASEMEHPQRDLPRALLVGTATVLALYLGLNAVYFYGAGVDELAGQVEVGLVASRSLFGPTGVSMVTIVLCASILASASAMTLVGPRVYYALGKDFAPFAFLSRTRRGGAPAVALIIQGIVTSIIIVSGRVDQIQQYAGFTLTLFASLAVSCVIVLSVRRPEAARPFRTWGYPLSPILFLGVSAWMMYWAFQGRPLESTLSFVTVLAGGLIFALFVRRGSASGS